MAQVAGFKVERTLKGKPTFVRIDLRKHANLIPVLEQNGFKIESKIKWSAKTKRAFAESQNGETFPGNIDDFWKV
jgi:hypothetical protein